MLWKLAGFALLLASLALAAVCGLARMPLEATVAVAALAAELLLLGWFLVQVGRNQHGDRWWFACARYAWSDSEACAWCFVTCSWPAVPVMWLVLELTQSLWQLAVCLWPHCGWLHDEPRAASRADNGGPPPYAGV